MWIFSRFTHTHTHTDQNLVFASVWICLCLYVRYRWLALFLTAFVSSSTMKRWYRLTSERSRREARVCFFSQAVERYVDMSGLCRCRCGCRAGQELGPAPSTCSTVLQPPGCCLDLRHRLHPTPGADRECPVLVFSDSTSSVFYPYRVRDWLSWI